MQRVLVFDVNETLLDLSALDEAFDIAFGDPSLRRDWFAALLRSAFALTIIGGYRPFGTLAREVLEALAASRGRDPEDPVVARILDGMATLPPHPDVPPGLERLAAAGYRLATLTNSAPDVAERQLEHAGLIGRLDMVISVDPVRRFKPARQTYLHAASALRVAPDDVVMIAAHDWDLHGAAAAGLAVAYLERPGTTFSPLGVLPELAAPDLTSLADQLIAAEGC